MDTQFPLVTIITPTYNQAHYLVQAIESVLSQDYPHVEFIVLNDGSKDHTEEILKKYTGRLIWETQPNMGEYRTIHKGFGKSKGEYILILSSDDYLLPGAIRSLVGYMLDHPELIIVYPDYNIVNETDETIQHIRNYDYNFLNAVRWFACMPGPAALIKRSVYEQLGGRDTSFRFVGDFDFYLRAGLLGPFDRVPQTLAGYRWHIGSQTQQKNYRQAEEHIRLVKKFYSNINLPDEVLKVKSEAFSSAYYLAGVVCSDNRTNWRKRWYFIRAFLFAASKYFDEYQYRLDIILQSLFGENIQKQIHGLMERRKLKAGAKMPKEQ